MITSLLFLPIELGTAYVSVKAGLQDLATTDKEPTDISQSVC